MLNHDEQRPKGRVLIVDDQPNICWVLSKILSERGHDVRTAPNGAKALAALAGFDCQVAVVDYRLPDRDGITLIAELTDRLPGLRAILMSSYGNATLQTRAVDQCLFAYLDKPFSNDVMIRTVEDAIGSLASGDGSVTKGGRTRTWFPG